jgi:hypothetical protein
MNRKRAASSTLALLTPDAGSAEKKAKADDGAVPKVKYIQTYQRTSCVRMALGGAVASPHWAGLFRDVSKKMTTLTWLASRALNHFLLSAVVNERFVITKRSVFVQVIGLCFRIGSARLSETGFTTNPVVAAWIAPEGRTLN